MTANLAILFGLTGAVCFCLGVACGVVGVSWAVRMGPRGSTFRKMKEIIADVESA